MKVLGCRGWSPRLPFLDSADGNIGMSNAPRQPKLSVRLNDVNKRMKLRDANLSCAQHVCEVDVGHDIDQDLVR